MTLQRIKGSIAFSCDKCSESFEPEEPTADARAAWQQAADEGWIVRWPKPGEPRHLCPNCQRR